MPVWRFCGTACRLQWITVGRTRCSKNWYIREVESTVIRASGACVKGRLKRETRQERRKVMMFIFTDSPNIQESIGPLDET
jgi:hypothetical protein